MLIVWNISLGKIRRPVPIDQVLDKWGFTVIILSLHSSTLSISESRKASLHELLGYMCKSVLYLQFCIYISCFYNTSVQCDMSMVLKPFDE